MSINSKTHVFNQFTTSSPLPLPKLHPFYEVSAKLAYLGLPAPRRPLTIISLPSSEPMLSLTTATPGCEHLRNSGISFMDGKGIKEIEFQILKVHLRPF